MLKHFLTFILILFSLQTSNSQTYQKLNFEGAGYVTELIPSPDGRFVWARTDIGGVYLQDMYGQRIWRFMSGFAKTPAPLMVQGLAINPSDPYTILICCGVHYLDEDWGRGIWKTTNTGFTWDQKLVKNFGGNNFSVKIGGECIIFDPTNSNRIYAGGLGQYPYEAYNPNEGLYRSDNVGENWYLVTQPAFQMTGNISSIEVNTLKPNQIFVGTDEGVYISDNYGVTFYEPYDFITSVYRIILRTNFLSPDDYELYIAHGDLSKISYLNGQMQYIDLTPYFDNGISELVGDVVTVKFVSGNQNTLLASRIGQPTRISWDGGITWGEPLPLTLDMQFNPKHALFTQDFIDYSRNNFMNTAFTPDIWYCSGGAGPYRSEDYTNMWRYIEEGINMPVVYNVTFSPNGSDVFIPISDWSMAVTNFSDIPEMNHYVRQRTTNNGDQCLEGDSYIPNITRALISNDGLRIYAIGATVYYSDELCTRQYAAMSKSINGGNNYNLIGYNHLAIYPDFLGTNAAIIDGVIKSVGTEDNLTIVMGGWENKVSPVDAYYYGVFYSLSSGNWFEEGNFLELNNSHIKYEYAKLDELFSSSFNLAVHPLYNEKRYLYLEGGYVSFFEGFQAGGFFVSDNSGVDWIWRSYVVPDPVMNYRDEGCLKVNPQPPNDMFIAIKNNGLFKSNDDGDTWTEINGNGGEWLSADQVDVNGNNIICFGRRSSQTGNPFNILYLSNDGGVNWYPITYEGMWIPTVRSLSFNPFSTNQIWIGTSGLGVFIYDIGSGQMVTNIKTKEKVTNPYTYSLDQNYPNPFNSQTTIKFSVAKSGNVKIKLFDILGREVSTIVDGQYEAGKHSVIYNASNLASGVYFYFMISGDYKVSKKMVLIK